MKKYIILAVLFCFFLTGCRKDDMSTVVVVTKNEAGEEEGVSYVQLLEKTPVAEVEGDPVSPDGMWKVMTVGETENYVSGVRVPEIIRIVNAESGEILWEDMGYLWQSALWSPDSKYLALAYAERTWTQIMVFETDTWTAWKFMLPDGTFIPEYTFLPEEDWGAWTEEDTLRVLVGRGGDAGEQTAYRCSLKMMDGVLSGNTELSETLLPGEYDFDHDGIQETVFLEGNASVLEKSSFWGLRVVENGQTIWTDSAATSHAGWNSLFAYERDGQDYLLRYDPYMGQGIASYCYQIFSLNDEGEQILLKVNRVEFDTNFGSPHFLGFDSKAIAEFLEEVHGYLDESVLLLSTESGVFRTGGSGTEFREDSWFWDEYCPYDETESMEENLKAFERFMKDARGKE